MESFLEFKPPQLPQLMTPDLLVDQMQSLYPEVQDPSNLLRNMGAALAAFGQARVECEARHEHFSAWMQWYKEHPTEKDKVVAFVTDHGAQFNAARDALRSLAQAVAQWTEAWGDRNNLNSIGALLAQVEENSDALAKNLQAVVASNLAPKQVKILPQKRPAP